MARPALALSRSRKAVRAARKTQTAPSVAPKRTLIVAVTVPNRKPPTMVMKAPPGIEKAVTTA